MDFIVCVEFNRLNENFEMEIEIETADTHSVAQLICIVNFIDHLNSSVTYEAVVHIEPFEWKKWNK